MASFFQFFGNKGQKAIGRVSGASRPTDKRAPSLMKPRRLMAESLEERQLLAVDVFTNAVAVAETANYININADSISIESIKKAIEEAAQTPEDDVIRVSSSNMTFSSLTDEITIDIDSSSFGSVAFEAVGGDVTIDANFLSRVFSIKNGEVSLHGFNLVNGVADYGGAIANAGTLTLTGVTLSGNEALVAGGAIANSGALFVQDSVIQGNTSEGDGGAVYEGFFTWSSETAPEWQDIPQQVGNKGSVLTVDLSEYVNSGNWTFSYELAESNSAILKGAPVLSEDGVLSFTFIGDEDYYGEDDFTPRTVTVTATDGKNTASTTFTVAIAEQTSSTLAAILSNMTYEDAKSEYVQGSPKRPIGYANDEGIPEPSIVDTAQPMTVQVWFQDFDWSGSSETVWDAGDNYFIMGVEYRLHLENATVTSFSDRTDLCRAAGTNKLLDNGDYEFIVVYTSDPYFGFEEAILLDVVTIEAIDPTQPVSVTIYQMNQDWTFPCYTRMYDDWTPRDQTRKHINVDPSQTLFVSTISNSDTPLSATPGLPWTSRVTWRDETSSASLETSAATSEQTPSLVISNSLIANNASKGNGTIFVSEDSLATLINVTLADNTALGAALYNANSSTNSLSVANSIVVNEGLAPILGSASTSGSVVNGTGWDGTVVYEGGSLFANSSQGDYTLAAGSVAINIGVDSAAVNVLGERLSQDLEGQKRLVATVDAGAYEYQGVAPSSPSNLSISDYFISNGKPSLTWGAPISPDGMDGYYVYLIAGNDRKLLTTVNSSLNKIYDLSEFVDFEVNSEYTFGVSAFNQFGESSISKISYVTSVAPTAPTNLIFGSYKNGSATISWTGSEYASSYRVETLESDGTWSVIGNTSENHYSVSGLSDFESYTFRITAVNVAGSASSDPLTFVTTTSPSSPENVSWASSYQGDGLATLTWEAVDHADGYVVRQKIDGDWIEVGVTTNPFYSFSGLENGSQYEYSVAAFARSTSGELFYSEAVEIGLVTIVAPSAPSNLSWTTDYLNGSITLAWNAVDSVSGYSVAQFVDGKWVEIASTTSLSYLFNSLTDNSVYSFGVAAYNMNGDTRLASDYTSIALNTAVVPAPPTNLHFESYGGGSSATLMWNSVTNASGYLIEMLDSSNQWVTVDTTTSTKYVLTVEENSFYTFRVSAYTTVGSVTKYSATTTTNLDTLTPPKGSLEASVAGFSTSDLTATLVWNGLDGASFYVISVKNADGSWNVLEDKATNLTFSLTGLEPNASYTFRVEAGNAAGLGASVTVDFTAVVLPISPEDAAFGAFDSEKAQIELSWSVVPYATGYLVEKFDFDSGKWITVERSDDTSTSYVVTNVSDFTTYKYRVSAYNAGGTSEPVEATFTNSKAPAAPENVEITYNQSSRSAVITWTLSEGAQGYYLYQKTDAGEWEKIASLSSISKSYIIQDIAENSDYYFALTAWNDDGESELSVVELSTLQAPATPSDAAFGRIDSATKSVVLSWSSVAGAAGYTIERQVGSEWIEVASLDGDETSWTLIGLENNTRYVFRIAAFNRVGTSSVKQVSITTGVFETPEAPTDLVVLSYDRDSHRATLSWSDNATTETGYEVQYSYDGIEWSSSAILPADITSRVANGLTPGKTYHFRVAAFNESGYSSWTTVVFDTPSENPEAPSDLTVESYDSSNHSAIVSWTDNSDNELGFRVQYSLNQVDWFTAASTEAGETMHVATGLVEGRTYYFRVASYNSYGVSDWASGEFTVPTVAKDKPIAPSNLVFSDPVFTSKGVDVTMNWQDNSSNETRFVVQFSYDNENWYGAGTTEANVSTRLAVGLVEGRTYYFRVAAYNDSGYSEWLTGSYTAPSSRVTAPSDIVFGEYSNGQVSMSWTDNSEDELGFVVQYSYDGVTWHRGGTTEANVTTRVATKMTPGRLYYFRVAAYSSGGYSDWTVGQFVTPSGAPVAPGEITFSEYSSTNHTVLMTWGDNSSDEVGFNVEYSVDGGDTWHASGNTSANVSNRTATGLRVGVTYEFRVRAFNVYGASGWVYGSFEVPVSVNAPEAPSDFIFGEYDADSKTLKTSWTDNATDESGYYVQYSVDGGKTWYAAATYGADVTSRVATSVVPGRSYVFRVAAFNSEGTSAWLTSDVYVVAAELNIPVAPSEIKFSDYNPDAGTLVMSWTDNSTNEKGFKVQYSVDDGVTWNDSAYMSSNEASRIVTGLVPGRVYTFRVAAYNNYGYSDWTTASYSVLAIEGGAAPTEPGFVYSSTRRRLTFEWEGAATSYNIQYRLTTDNEWYSLTSSTNSVTIDGVVYGSAYYFRVQGVDQGGVASEWLESSFDTSTLGPVDSASIVEDELTILDEIFKEFVEDVF